MIDIEGKGEEYESKEDHGDACVLNVPEENENVNKEPPNMHKLKVRFRYQEAHKCLEGVVQIE